MMKNISVKEYIKNKFSSMLLLLSIMSLLIVSLSIFVFYEKNKNQAALKSMNSAIEVAADIQDLSSSITIYSIRGDIESLNKIKFDISNISSKKYFIDKLPQDKSNLFKANLNQINILTKILIKSKNPIYRQQLSVSIQNLNQVITSSILFPQINYLKAETTKTSGMLAISFAILGISFLIFFILFFISILRTRESINKSILEHLDKLSKFSNKISNFDFSQKEISLSNFKELDEVSCAIVSLSKSFEYILNTLPSIGVVIAEADENFNNIIVYQNKFFEELYPSMKKDLEESFGKTLPYNMLGQSIHVMHPDANRIKNILKEISPGSIRENKTIPVGQRMMASSTLAVPGDAGGTSYYVTLWQDKTLGYTLRNAITRTSEGLEKILVGKNNFGTVVSIANSGIDNVKNVFNLSSSVRQAMDKMVKTVNYSRENMSGVTKQISTFKDEIQSIEAIVGSISKIAAQTHVLSLNAAIEAARAGDDGRGFMVVADSVRDLAKNTEDLTNSIESKISVAINETDKIANLISSLDLDANKSTELTKDATEKFSLLESIVKEVGESYKTITEKTVSGVEVLSVVDEVVTDFNKLKVVKL